MVILTGEFQVAKNYTSSVILHRDAGAVRFDTKEEAGPLGEGGERYYNYVRLVRSAK